MSTGKNTKEAASSNDAGTSTEAPSKPEKAKRFHAPEDGRIPREVVRSFYDVERNVVKDVVLVPKIVQDRKGNDVEVMINRVVVSLDKELQAKYCRSEEKSNIVEIEE